MVKCVCWDKIPGSNLKVEGVRSHRDVKENQMKPKVICICGSTRFADYHAIKKWQFEKQGTICLMISYLPAWYAETQGWNGHDHFGEKSGCKKALDELHLRKIDLADEIFVINKDGYIGESTKREIEYAKAKGKPIHYWCEETNRIVGKMEIQSFDKLRKSKTMEFVTVKGKKYKYELRSIKKVDGELEVTLGKAI